MNRLPQRKMHRGRDDPQSGAREHHHRDFGNPGKRGEIFGVSGVLKAGPIKALFVDRIGDERGGAPAHDITNPGLYRAEGRLHARGLTNVRL